MTGHMILGEKQTELRRANMSEPIKGNKVMTEVATRGDIALNWDVFVTPVIPMVTSDLPPGTKQGMWSPISSTLI